MVAELLYLEKQGSSLPIEMLINSSGTTRQDGEIVRRLVWVVAMAGQHRMGCASLLRSGSHGHVHISSSLQCTQDHGAGKLGM